MRRSPMQARHGGGGGGGGRGARNTAARKAVAKNTTKAQNELARARKDRANEANKKSTYQTRQAQTPKKQAKQAKTDDFVVGKRHSRKARSKNESPHMQATGDNVIAAKKGLRKAQKTQGRVNRLTKLSDHIAKRAGSGRRTHFLSDNPS